ncbi:Ankyrin repeat-containing protein [Nymphaea thermarum]|nr:Ankyrin repeat-containing protein [Nymphaea thermarum]
MDRRLFDASVTGNTTMLHQLVQEDEEILDQVDANYLNTVLHLAARFGQRGFAEELIKMRPAMASAENRKLETPLHEASREGNLEVLSLLVDMDPCTVLKLNSENESALSLACKRGHVSVVKELLSRWQLLAAEVDSPLTSLHLAASGGYTEIVREILKARPDFALKVDQHGFTPLHLASSKGHLEITRDLLRLNPDLCYLRDTEGRSPLHWAAMKGRVAILDEILSIALDSSQMLTNLGESVLHLSVKNNQFEAVKYLVEKLDVTELVNLADHNGNTILHLAVAGKLSQMVRYIVEKTGVEVNALNRNGYTALDVVENDTSNSGALSMGSTLRNAGARASGDVPPSSPLIHRIVASPAEVIRTPTMSPSRRNSPTVPPRRRRRHGRRKTYIELRGEGLRNARDTITVVAVLIATVTFAAVISPPGGTAQDGELAGRAVMGGTAAFKVFMVSNDVALFTSLSIVIVLVSVIPFRRRTLTRLLTVTHKVMWISVAFMVVAYMAAAWIILPSGKGRKWVLLALYAIGGGTIALVFIGLWVLLVRHWLKLEEFKIQKQSHGRRSPAKSHSQLGDDELPSLQRRSDYDSSSDALESSEKEGYIMY